MNLSMTAISRAFNSNQATFENYMHLPLIDMDKEIGGRENTLWNEYVTHWCYESPGKNGKPYLHSPDGDRLGTMDTTEPGKELPTQYAYDPRNSVPSIGGNANHRNINKTLSSGAVLKGGSFDQRKVESRDDVLVFSTEVLEEDVQVIGPVSVKLYANTDARDTDFTAVLIDVRPDDSAMNVTEGIVRARFRESIWRKPKLLTPNQVYEYTLELLPTARVFRQGHRIRLHLSSSRFPLWDRNTNTGNDPATDTKTVVANQIIHHDHKRPSHLVLPVVPSGIK